MVLDSSSDTCFNLDSCYNKDSSKSSKPITQNSENCWSTVQISSTSECAYKYKSDWNYTNEGALSSDTILVGSTTIKDLVFGRILKESESLKAGGILGLGPSNLDELYGTSLIETLINVCLR
jgi:Tfp pilus assembly protein PilV